MTPIALYDDKELLTLLTQGDQQAFEVLYRRYWLRLYDAAYQRLRNCQQAEDIVQDIFVSIWVRRESLCVDNLKAYLQAAVRFRVFNYVERDSIADIFYEPFDRIANESCGADGQLMEKEMMNLLYAFSNTLPEKRRRIFLMRVRENMTTREIAENLSISPKTVQNQLGRAGQALRTHVLPLLIFFLAVCSWFL